MQNRPREFSLEVHRKRLNNLDNVLDSRLKIYVVGGYVMASNGLKTGTKDIDVIVENRAQSEKLINALANSGYYHLPIDSMTKEYRDLSAAIYENDDGFRWDIFTKIVANKLTLTESMRSRAKLTHNRNKLSLFELSKEDIFLMKGVTDRERDLDDMSLIAKSGVDYKTVFEECLIPVRQNRETVGNGVIEQV